MDLRRQLLSLAIYPSIGVGPFTIGQPIRNAIDIIQNQSNIYNFELKYCKEDPLASDLILDLVEDGFLLRFEPRSQRLQSIEIYSASKLKISYANSTFCSPGTSPTLVQVYNHFGPTYPGVFDVARSVYRLSYPGISFEFVIPKEFVHLYQRQSLADLPLEFDDNTSPPAARISIYEEPPSNNNNNNNKNNTAAAASIDDDIIVQIGVGIQRGTDMVTFASSAQDLLSTLGQPNRIHVKQHDKLRIHSASHADAPLADYFYNYFDLGIDFLLDGQRHCVKKIILHTNLPSHTEFNRYAKCPFRIQLGGGGGAHSAPSSDGEQASDGSGSDGSSGSAGGSAGGGGIAIGTIGPNARFEHVQQLLGPVSSQPVVHNRGTAENPFGALLFYGYEHMIFEVTQNGYLASVCLFE